MLTSTGSFQTVTGIAYSEQRITRNVFTNSATPLPDGSTVAPDYNAHPEYGLNGGALVDRPYDDAWAASFSELAKAAVLSDNSVDTSVTPVVVVSFTIETVSISVTYKPLAIATLYEIGFVLGAGNDFSGDFQGDFV